MTTPLEDAPVERPPRSVVSIDDLSDADIDALFVVADSYLENTPKRGDLHCVRGRRNDAADRLIATLFYEPSTRTRLSFEAAALRLGADFLSSPQAMATSSAAKGETIADTSRVIGTYVDAIVIRHPLEGAAQVAAEYAGVPVINAGDGEHEHPTQTLCDLYTIRQGQKATRGKASQRTSELLKNVRVLVKGDLKHGRTVHSLVYALARFGAVILPMPAPECDLPEHVKRRLARDFQCVPTPMRELVSGVDVVYVVPQEQHQLSLLPGTPDLRVELSMLLGKGTVDFIYATRLQSERVRTSESQSSYPATDLEFLKRRSYRKSQVLHPLPRVNELSYEIDASKRAVYFQQAAYGVPVRMALLAALLGVGPGIEGRKRAYTTYSSRQGIRCDNAQCIATQEAERKYLKPKFLIVADDPLQLRCVYCDHEYEALIVSHANTRKFYRRTQQLRKFKPEHLVIFKTEADALQEGHTAAKRGGANAD